MFIFISRKYLDVAKIFELLLDLHTLPTTSPYIFIFRNYAALIGVVSHDFFTELSNTEMEEGIAREQRDQMLQVNSYHIILELYSIMLMQINKYIDCPYVHGIL